MWSGLLLLVWTFSSQSVSGRLGGLPLGAILLPFVIPSHLLDMAARAYALNQLFELLMKTTERSVQ